MPTIVITKDEAHEIGLTLSMHYNYITTGDVTTSPEDISAMGKSAPPDAKLKSLSPDQMELLVSIHKLKIRFMNLQ